MKWFVRSLLWYRDRNREGLSECVDKESALEWVRSATRNNNFLAISIEHGPRTIARWERKGYDKRNALRRVWK